MNSAPSGGTAHRRSPWQALISTLLVTVMSAVTVLGAVLLSLQGQAPSSQPIIQEPENEVLERFPTAPAATPPADSFTPAEADATRVTEQGEEIPSPSPGTDITPTSFGTGAPEPPATRRPCGGGAPLDWRLYKVQRGDTLFSLARRYGTTMYWVIYYNCLVSDQLWAGQQLYLPVPPTPLAPATATATPFLSATATLMPTPSSTFLPGSPSPLPSTPSPSPTDLPTLTVTSEPLPSATATTTTRPTPASSITPTPTFTPPVNPSATSTMAPTLDATPTLTSRPPVSVTLEPASTATPGVSPTPTPVPTTSPSPEAASTKTLGLALTR